MIRSFLYLNVQPGKRNALLEWYREVGSLDKAVELAGCKATEMYFVPEDENLVLVTALWADSDGYQSWVQNPWRQSLSAGISQYLDADFAPDAQGYVYESVLSAPTD